MLNKYKCKKDWFIDDKLFFEKDKFYLGMEYEFNSGKRLEIYILEDLIINFYTGTEYFEI